MALTREERQAIETLIKKVRTLEDKVNMLENINKALQKMVDGINSESNLLDWSSDQIAAWLRPYIVKYTSGNGKGIMLHNHTNEQQGGACFAKLGASLISNEE